MRAPKTALGTGGAIVHDALRRRWLEFSEPRELLIARTIDEVVPRLERIHAETTFNGLWAVGFLAYEAAPAFEPAARAKADRGFPLLWFGLYEAPEEVDFSVSGADPGPCLDPLTWTPSITPAEYFLRLEEIGALIRDGNTYQVNFSFRLRTPLSADPWSLFLHLVGAQGPCYSAFIDAGRWVICSASPELFFRLDASSLESRPMKGTAPRGLWYEQDLQNAVALGQSEKDRAENVMIVDMVRNDLGRIARPGSVRVPELFAVERYPTVWQLTSNVSAETDAPLDRIFGALFPPASTTGAPKPRTTEIIAALESTPRRVYTGAIGFVGPGRQAQFNVAIRTVLIDRTRGEAEYGIGGGIVADSVVETELAEARVKASVLGRRDPSFDLLETMLWTPEAGIFLLERHLRRLTQSAEYFGFRFDPDRVRKKLSSLADEMGDGPRKVRLVVSRSGAVAATTQPMGVEGEGFGDVTLAGSHVDASDPFLYHKTTHREVYERAARSRPGCTDVLLSNEKGEITESTVANVAVEFPDGLWTPPVECGLLAGTYRGWLLERGRIRERVVTIQGLSMCSAVYLMNSVRGMHRVRVNLT